ncbi:MAG: SRPBCC domain-containing protein [Imperialibacter sp.]|uniref:SRPBCC family protein n=1 Tax=Imperialibacter sp. TaxID=2038411 RepID=UPI0032EB6FAF
MAKTPFTIEKTYKAPTKKVWEAITDKDKMKVWYFNLAEFKAEVGFEFQFKGGPPEKQYLHICEVTEVIKEKKLTHSWRYDGEPGISYVTWELFDQGSSTLLRLTHSNLESFNSGNPDLVPENFAAGWTDIVGRSLREYLEGK